MAISIISENSTLLYSMDIKILFIKEVIKNMSIKKEKRYFKPGETAEVSGQYKNIQTGKEVTVTRDEPFPPTPKKRQRYILADRTKHKK